MICAEINDCPRFLHLLVHNGEQPSAAITDNRNKVLVQEYNLINKKINNPF